MSNKKLAFSSKYNYFVLTGGKVIVTTIGLMNELKNYKSPKSKITRMIKDKKLTQIRRGVFLEPEEKNYSLKGLSGVIYGPSYVSFETALSFYGLIPEKVIAITCAIYGKNKNKMFHTPVGSFYYNHVPKKVYPFGLNLEVEGEYKFQIATPEKALLDMIYKSRNSNINFKDFIYSDLRIEKSDLIDLNYQELEMLSKMYNLEILEEFCYWLRMEIDYAHKY